MTRASLVAGAAFVLAGLCSLSAQRLATGTAQITGIVITTDAPPAPVRRAIVTLTDSGLGTRSEISDDEGRFQFDRLPAGRYTLSATRAAFIKALYGARRPGRPGTPLTLAWGQTLTDVTLSMARGAAISGVVRDPFGEPAAGVQVLVFRAGSRPSPSPAMRGERQILTDDRGAYRVFGLEPGTYHAAAVPRLPGAQEMRVLTTADVDAALRSLQQRTAPRGGAAPAVAPSPERASARDRVHSYSPVFHPGTPVQNEAAPISVSAGEDRGDVDIPLLYVPTATIEGVVLADGSPVAAQLVISGDRAPMPFSFSGAPILGARPDATGRFKYTNVTPGRYTITARLGGSAPRWATADVTMSGDDVTGVTLALQPALVFSGRVQFDALTLTPPDDLRQIRIVLAPPPGAGGSMALNATVFGQRFQAAGNPRADGTFEVPGVLPGPYQLNATVPGSTSTSGWWLRSARSGGRDLLDSPLVFGTSDVRDVVLTFTDRRSELSGTLQTAASQPAVELYVIAFPADRQLWTPESRRVKSARPSSDGRFVFSDLPAGEYLLAALDDLVPAQLSDAAFLEQVAPSAVKVAIADGAKVVQDLRLR